MKQYLWIKYRASSSSSSLIGYYETHYTIKDREKYSDKHIFESAEDDILNEISKKWNVNHHTYHGFNGNIITPDEVPIKIIEDKIRRLNGSISYMKEKVDRLKELT